LIVDEPERHLHPRAQVDLAEWLAGDPENRDVLVATHAVAFLNMPGQSTSVLVLRDRSGGTYATDLTDDTFGRLSEFATEAGLASRAEALQTLSCILLVEGLHDELVLHHSFGPRLARERVLVVPVRGANNVNSIVDAPWLSRFGAPMVVLFDDVRAATVESRKRPTGKDIAARAVWELLKAWDGPGRPRVASFPLPDIFRALPERCVDLAVQRKGGRFSGWKTVDEAFGRDSSVGFKRTFLRSSQLPADTNLDQLLRDILQTCRRLPDPLLRKAVEDALTLAQPSS
jgi:hypothetical protein